MSRTCASSPPAAPVAVHPIRPDGAGAVVRDEGHVVALEKAVLAAFSDAKPCTHKTRRPPSASALAEADRLRGVAPDQATRVVVDLSAYAALVPPAAARPRTTSAFPAAPMKEDQ